MKDNLIIELNNVYLKSSRGNQVFSDLSLTLEAGKTAIIEGSAGSGKSSLVELLLGLTRPESGSVAIFGDILHNRRGAQMRKNLRRIGGVGGIFTLIPSMTVAENITYPLVLVGERKSVRKERLLKMLTEFSLLNQASDYPSNLTRVERMLVLFARASIANQPLLIVDEPFAGLDGRTFDRMAKFLSKASISGRSMLILTSEKIDHDIPNTDRYQLEDGVLV